MPEQPEQPPRAVEVPDAVLLAMRGYSRAVLEYEHARVSTNACDLERDELDDAQSDAWGELACAIDTALREAREQGAADTARLERLAELLDVAPSMRLLHGKWEEGEMISISQLWPHNKDWQSEPHSSTLEALRAAIDATRALYGEAES